VAHAQKVGGADGQCAKRPAGAVGGGKAFITGSGTPIVALRFTNRTSPAVTSITYFSAVIDVQIY
jgi:hypothetical protein